MALIAIRVLIINPQVQVAIRTKQALERTGRFEVTPFTGAEPALEHLRGRPYEVVLLDFNVRDLQPIDVVLRLRAVQPDLAIIASPANAHVNAVVSDLHLNGSVDFPIETTELAALIQRAASELHDSLPDTTEAPTVRDESDTVRLHQQQQPSAQQPAPPPPPEGVPEFSTLDSVLVKFGGLEVDQGTQTIEVDMSDAGYADEGGGTIEFVLKSGTQSSGRDKPRAPKEEDSALFRQLAAEEPPLPTIEESGTVADLMIGVGDTNLREVVDILRRTPLSELMPPPPRKLPEAREETPEVEEDQPAAEPGGSTARMILESALDESTPLSFSLDDLIRNIESQSGAEDPVRPLPSWVDEVERYVREPDFLPESMGDTTGMTDSSFQTTRMTHSEDVPESAGDMDTERMMQSGPPPPPPPPPPSLPEARPEPTRPAEPAARAEPTRRSEPVEPEPEEAEPEWEPAAEAEAAPPVIEAAPEPEAQPEEEPVHEDEPAPAPTVRSQPVRQEAELDIPTGMITVGTESDDPRIARLALNLTQGALELTAEATLLAEGREIVAYAGEMPLEEVEQISGLVADDWEARPNESRIRFITSPASGKDYMLYSRATAAGLTLSLVFAGNMPLRVIRRQSDRLLEALSTVPDTPAPGEITEDVLEDLESLAELEQQEAEITSQMQAITPVEEAAPVAVGPLTPYACVWLVRDPDDYLLSNEVAQAIVAGLDLQLSRAGWDIVTIDVHEDYVYLVAGVPGERSAQEIVADLKQLASEVAYGADPSFDPAQLWDDSYFALLPGRELDISEIQRFINFARSR